jgi:hypothetical protein
MLELNHNMFVSRKMEADYVGPDLATVSFSTEKDNGALLTLGDAVSSPVYNQVVDMNHYKGVNPSDINNDAIYVLDAPDVFQYSGLRVDIVDPRCFSVPAGYPARAKRLVAGDEAWWSEGCFATTAITVGTSHVIPTANSDKWSVIASASSQARVVGKVIAAENVAVGNNLVAGYRVRIVKA